MIKRQQYLPVFIFFLLLSILVMIVFRDNRVLPAVMQKLFSPIEEVVLRTSLITSSSEINALKEQNLSLTEKLVADKKLRDENAALRDQFQTENSNTKQLLPVRITGMPEFLPGVSLPEYLVIDRGIKDRIRVGQVVVYKDTLIGIVVHVNTSFSQVTLMTNAASATTARTMNTSALGVAKGLGNGEMILDNVTMSDHLEKDDMVVTNGDQKADGTGFPSGLVIGKITSVEKNPSAIFQKAKIASMVDISKLTTVFVIIGK